MRHERQVRAQQQPTWTKCLLNPRIPWRHDAIHSHRNQQLGSNVTRTKEYVRKILWGGAEQRTLMVCLRLIDECGGANGGVIVGEGEATIWVATSCDCVKSQSVSASEKLNTWCHVTSRDESPLSRQKSEEEQNKKKSELLQLTRKSTPTKEGVSH